MPDVSQAPTIRRLASVLHGLQFSDLRQATIRSAQRCLLDGLGCAAAGRTHAAVESALSFVTAAFTPGPASIWFQQQSANPMAAAFVNAFAASVCDLDDGHRAASGHPGAAVIPVAIATGQSVGASLDDVLLAIVCGYEAGLLIARARDPARLSSVATGRWSAAAAAAAAAKLVGLTEEQMAHAMVIAENQAPNMVAADHSGFAGSDIKEGIPWSVLTGMAAVEQAARGMTGYLAALDNAEVYVPGAASPDVSRDFLIESTYFKIYGCCRWCHSPLDAVLEMRRLGLEPASVDRIEVATFRRAASLQNATRPQNVIAAQFSMPFTIAVALLEGPDALSPVAPAILGREDIIALAERVSVTVDPQLDSLYPVTVPGRVRVTTSGKVIEREVRIPLGDPTNPLSDAELVEKFARLSTNLKAEANPRCLGEDLLAPRTGRSNTAAMTSLISFIGHSCVM